MKPGLILFFVLVTTAFGGTRVWTIKDGHTYEASDYFKMDQSGNVNVWLPNENRMAANTCFFKYTNLCDKDQSYIVWATKMKFRDWVYKDGNISEASSEYRMSDDYQHVYVWGRDEKESWMNFDDLSPANWTTEGWLALSTEKANKENKLIIRKTNQSVESSRVQIPALDGVKWQEGPSIGDLGGTAKINVPAGYVFAGANDTRVFMEAIKNPTSGNEMGLIKPAGDDWFVLFEFDNVGYVRDDEKNSLDAEAMLESIKKGTAAGNEERQRRGWPIMTILGWEQKPNYNEATHNLEWAIRGESEGTPIINFNTRLLGRQGVMRVTLVVDPSLLSSTLPKFKNVLAGFDFKQGQKYAEFSQGDKVAKYGLTALITGGAAAVAVKAGMFKWVWKGLVVGVLAIVAFIKKLFSRKKSQ